MTAGGGPGVHAIPGVCGLGVDAVDIERFRRVLARRPSIARRLFSDSERLEVSRSRNSTSRLAARFAAKEAVMKALGVGIGAFDMRDVEIGRLPSGEPRVVLAGRAAALAESKAVSGWHISLTHTDLVAVASVVAVGAVGAVGAHGRDSAEGVT